MQKIAVCPNIKKKQCNDWLYRWTRTYKFTAVQEDLMFKEVQTSSTYITKLQSTVKFTFYLCTPAFFQPHIFRNTVQGAANFANLCV